MKIAIDIPNAQYEYLAKIVIAGEEPLGYFERVIMRGTPLPKGHGRLKDIDAFITKVKADRKHSAYLRSWTADDVLNALDNSYAPTIIERSDTDECNL